MEKIGDTLRRQGADAQANAQRLIQEILADEDISAFIKQQKLSPEEIKRSVPKFNQFRNERQKFQESDAGYSAKGFQPVLVMNEGYADVAYLETQEHKDAVARQDARNRITLVGLPSHLRDISEKDLAMDPNRVEIYRYLQAYIKNLEESGQKGLYLYGNFGVGKSYLMAYLANRLSVKYGKQTTLLHFPTFSVDIKNAINDGTVRDQIETIKKAEILVLDDIGAEQQSSWVRDDILQVILQYRMQENLLTFFTSNFDFKGLEKHFAMSRSGDESWQAKRVMERIRYLAKEMHLQGENRR